MAERFLITGAMGCIGAWVTKLLVDEGADVTIFDLSTEPRRLGQLMTDDELARVRQLQGDITSAADVDAAVEGMTHVIHLAALQVPFCKANPRLGAAVNVVGTVNVFEAVRESNVVHTVFASSAAVYGHPRNYPTPVLPPHAPRLPETLYGVFKVANEDTAGIYWADHEVPSIGLRPYTVFGPTRDQGVTAQPTQAIEAAVGGEPFHIAYGGRAGFMFVRDVAETFIAAARTAPSGGDTYSLSGDIVEVGEFVDLANAATGAELISHADEPLPFPDGTEDGPLRLRLGSVPHTPLAEAIEATASFFGSGGGR